MSKFLASQGFIVYLRNEVYLKAGRGVKGSWGGPAIHNIVIENTGRGETISRFRDVDCIAAIPMTSQTNQIWGTAAVNIGASLGGVSSQAV